MKVYELLVIYHRVIYAFIYAVFCRFGTCITLRENIKEMDLDIVRTTKNAIKSKIMFKSNDFNLSIMLCFLYKIINLLIRFTLATMQPTHMRIYLVL
jgi:hypothetical protein